MNNEKFKIGDFVKVIEDDEYERRRQTWRRRTAHAGGEMASKLAVSANGAHGIVVDVRVMSVSVRLAGFSHNRPYHVQDLELVARA